MNGEIGQSKGGHRPFPDGQTDGLTVPNPDRRYLFICGCARSGTGAMWRLLTAHAEIVLGLERFIHERREFSPELFEKGKFFDVRLERNPHLKKYYDEARDRFDAAKYVGDKIPSLYLNYGRIEATFPNAEIVFMLRNIIDVAGSYERRRREPKGNWSRDFRVAVDQWRQSIDLTLEFIAKGSRTVRIHVVSYEDVWLEPVNLRALFDSLGLGVTQEVRQRYGLLMGQSEDLEATRSDSLTSKSRHYIAMEAPFESFRALLGRRLVFQKDAVVDKS